MVQVSPINSTLPYTAAGPYNVTGPFFAQAANVVTYAPDFVYIDYVNTEAAIQCKGRLNTTFYYEPPNATWSRTALGAYTTGSISITDN
jgi:hypothetical protein